MKHPRQLRCSAAVILKAACAALAILATAGQAQVTFQQITNGLVDYYPLNSVLPGNPNATPDYVNRRDMTMVNMTSNNIVTAYHPGIEASSNCFNFTQSGGPTVIYYNSTGQVPLTGGGDFLPFINQRGATMNFWVKGNGTTVPFEQRVFAECANDGENDPFFSISATTAPANNPYAHFLIKDSANATDPNGVSCIVMADGTYELPAPGGFWQQQSNYTADSVLDGNWHMFTVTIETNGDIHTFVDGNYDPGYPAGGPYVDNEGNPAIGVPIYVTNNYYTTNVYPSAGVSNPPPNGFVRWMMNGIYQTASTTFGGFRRNGNINGGLPCLMSDIGFWNRVLSPAEIAFVMTNGLPGFPQIYHGPGSINNFTADFYEVGLGDQVTLRWNVTGETSFTISGVGDVTYLGSTGSTNVTLAQNQTYTFTLTAHNGITADLTATVSVKTFPGVPSDWHLIQRFDGVFGNTTQGVNSNGWVSLLGTFTESLDRFNVVTVNGNKVLSPKSGYVPDPVNSPVGWDTRGAVSYGFLNGLTIPPYQENTLFFRFSLRDPGSFASSLGIYSGLDFAAGFTDFGFATGPIAGTQPPGGGGTYGPGFHIVRYHPLYGPSPFDLTADDYGGSSVTNSYSYVNSVDTNGLQTNVNYYAWLDVSNDNTHAVVNGGVTNTVQEPVYSLWLQKQGDPSRSLLFSGFHGDRDYSQAGINSDYPTPYLNKVFANIATEAFQNGDVGAFFETNNMIALDDFYLSKSGFNSTIPRLFNITSIVRDANSATINWNSLGSLFQTNTYSVQRTFSLNPPSWITLTNGLPSGGDTTSFTDGTLGSSSTAFYRVTWP